MKTAHHHLWKLDLNHWYITLYIILVFFSNCDKQRVEPRNSFFEKSEWQIESMVYTNAAMLTDNGRYISVIKEDIRYFNQGTIRIVDSSFQYGSTNTGNYIDYDGKIMVLKALNDSINPNNDNIEVIIIGISDNYEIDGQLGGIMWLGNRSGQAGVLLSPDFAVREVDKKLELHFYHEFNSIWTNFYVKLK